MYHILNWFTYNTLRNLPPNNFTSIGDISVYYVPLDPFFGNSYYHIAVAFDTQITLNYKEYYFDFRIRIE